MIILDKLKQTKNKFCMIKYKKSFIRMDLCLLATNFHQIKSLLLSVKSVRIKDILFKKKFNSLKIKLHTNTFNGGNILKEL